MKSFDVIKILEDLGFNVKKDKYRDYIDGWLKVYRNNIENFHEYEEYNGKDKVKRNRKTLGMPKKACEDWADTIFNDNVKINVEEDDYKLIDDLLISNNFRPQFTELIEKSFALGTGGVVEFLDEKGSINLDFITAQSIYPLEVSNGEIVSCAFASVNENELYINIHEKLNGKYVISNHFYSLKNGTISKVGKEGIVEIIESPVKLFQIIKPGIANSIDFNQPLGMSIFANAIDETKSVDTAYTSFDREIDNGKMRVYLRAGAATVNIDEQGHASPIFNKDQTEFYVLPEDDTNNKGEFVHVSTPELRIEQISSALETNLNLFGRKVGFGDDYYSFKDGSVYTNTSQVISTNSKFYKTRTKHTSFIENVIIDIVRGVMYLLNKSEYTKDITVDFDDSIVEDTAETKRQALMEYNAGLISKEEYFVMTRNFSKQQAEAFVIAQQADIGLTEDTEEE